MTIENIIFKIPLYHKLEIIENGENIENYIIDFLNFKGNIVGYNPIINENTDYKVRHVRSSNKKINNREIIKSILTCVRTDYEIVLFFQYEIVEQIDNNGNDIEKYILEKIGQSPSLADIEINKHKKYTKLIPKKYLSELNKATGLASHGIGVGSFVYLRRIFEKLIERHHMIAKNKDNNWNENDYKIANISTKIKFLKNYLPKIVVENKKVYSILSKGIHALDEDECIKYFPIIKDAIIEILEQEYYNNEKEKREDVIKKRLIDIQKKII